MALVISVKVVNCGVNIFSGPPKKMIAEIVFINIMLAYSARKNKANGPPAYSTLKPETSSDSPSVKSNGERLVSARVETYHMRARGQDGIMSQIVSWAVEKAVSVKFPAKIISARRMRPRLTS